MSMVGTSRVQILQQYKGVEGSELKVKKVYLLKYHTSGKSYYHKVWLHSHFFFFYILFCSALRSATLHYTFTYNNLRLQVILLMKASHAKQIECLHRQHPEIWHMFTSLKSFDWVYRSLRVATTELNLLVPQFTILHFYLKGQFFRMTTLTSSTPAEPTLRRLQHPPKWRY